MQSRSLTPVKVGRTRIRLLELVVHKPKSQIDHSDLLFQEQTDISETSSSIFEVGHSFLSSPIEPTKCSRQRRILVLKNSASVDTKSSANDTSLVNSDPPLKCPPAPKLKPLLLHPRNDPFAALETGSKRRVLKFIY